MKIFFTTISALLLVSVQLLAQKPSYTANNQVTPYTGQFRPGMNFGYNPPWTENQLADIAAGNPSKGILGLGTKSVRPSVTEEFAEYYGYEALKPTFEYYKSVGMSELTVIVGYPKWDHRDKTQHCYDVATGKGEFSEMFDKLYEPIWDNNFGTPINENNHYANYIYKTVKAYKDYVRFWEIWNEPGFDYTGVTGWRNPDKFNDGQAVDAARPAGSKAYNWWVEDPRPCDYKLRAPIQYYIRTLRISWEVIKAVDPTAYVSASGMGFQAFLDAVLRNTDNPGTAANNFADKGKVTPEYPFGGGAYFDVMGYHSYPHFDGSTVNYDGNFFQRDSDHAADNVAGTGKFAKQKYYQDVFDKYGYNGTKFPKKEWIITELNVPRKDFSNGTIFASELGQRNFMTKAYISMKLAGIHQAHIFALSDTKTDAEATYEFDIMGMYKKLANATPYNQVMNDAGLALKTTTDFLYNTEYDAARTAQLAAPAGVRARAFKRTDGTYIYTLWAETKIDKSEEASGTYSFPAALGITEITRYGWDYAKSQQKANSAPSGIVLNSSPIFVTVAGQGPITGDTTPPSVTLSTPTTTVSGAFTVTATFNEAVTGVALADFTLTNGTASNLTGTGTTYTFTVTPAGAGAITIVMPAVTAVDAAGNANTASNTLTVTNQVVINPNPSQGVDIALSMTADNANPGIYRDVKFTIIAKNTGTQAATKVIVAVPFPDKLVYTAGTASANTTRLDLFRYEWEIGSIPAGGEAKLELTLFTLVKEGRVMFVEVKSMNEKDVDSTPGNGVCCDAKEDDEASLAVNGGGTSTNVTPTPTNPTVAANCIPKSKFPWEDWIAKVKIGNVDNASSKTEYSDFKSKVVTAEVGKSLALELTAGFSYFGYAEYWKVWVDFNRDGTYAESEAVAAITTPKQADGTKAASAGTNITIPAGTATGTTTMRVMMKRGSAPTSSCENIANGEIEDYTIQINKSTSLGPREIEISDIKVDKNWDKIGLYFVTNRQYKNSYVLLEKSANGRNFVGLDHIQQNMTIETGRAYRLEDIKPIEGDNYYRLKAVLPNGTVEYSNVIKVDYNRPALFSIFPQPAKGYTFLNLERFDGKLVDILVMNNVGQLLHKEQGKASAQPYRLDLNDMENGNYILLIQPENAAPVAQKLLIFK
jgi:GEVED domain/Domain of unknown function DUF11/Bacterial Ig-like domain